MKVVRVYGEARRSSKTSAASVLRNALPGSLLKSQPEELAATALGGEKVVDKQASKQSSTRARAHTQTDTHT